MASAEKSSLDLSKIFLLLDSMCYIQSGMYDVRCICVYVAWRIKN